MFFNLKVNFLDSLTVSLKIKQKQGKNNETVKRYSFNSDD